MLDTVLRVLGVVSSIAGILVFGFAATTYARGKSRDNLTPRANRGVVAVFSYWTAVAAANLVSSLTSWHTYDMVLRMSAGVGLLLLLTIPQESKANILRPLNRLGRIGVFLLGVVVIVSGAVSL